MTENQTRILKNWITIRTSNPVEHDYVFHSITYRKLTPASLRDILKNASEKLEISIYPYKLRYTCVSMLWRNGVDIYVISKMLGQRKVETTITYLWKKYAEAARDLI